MLERKELASVMREVKEEGKNHPLNVLPYICSCCNVHVHYCSVHALNINFLVTYTFELLRVSSVHAGDAL